LNKKIFTEKKYNRDLAITKISRKAIPIVITS